MVALAALVIGAGAFAAPNKGRIVTSTGSGALSATFTPTNQAYITNVRVHLSSAGTQETFTVYINSAAGTAYDVVLYSVSMAGVTDISWIPSGRLLMNAGDVLTLTWTNTDARTWGTEIGYEY